MKLACLPFAVFTKKMAKTTAAAAVLSISGLVNLAQAGIIDTDNDSFIDQDTQLEWMDFGINNQYSYYQVSSMLGEGELYNGWRIATEDEAINLVVNAFSDDADEWIDRIGSQSPAPVTAIAHHMDETTGLFKSSNFETTLDAMGYNWLYPTGDEMYYSVGLFRPNTGSIGGLYINDFESGPERNDGVSVYSSWNVDGGTQHDGYSTLLVRGAEATSGTEVPEPSTLAIFALGIMGLAFRNNKKPSFNNN